MENESFCRRLPDEISWEEFCRLWANAQQSYKRDRAMTHAKSVAKPWLEREPTEEDVALFLQGHKDDCMLCRVLKGRGTYDGPIWEGADAQYA